MYKHWAWKNEAFAFNVLNWINMGTKLEATLNLEEVVVLKSKLED